MDWRRKKDRASQGGVAGPVVTSKTAMMARRQLRSPTDEEGTGDITQPIGRQVRRKLSSFDFEGSERGVLFLVGNCCDLNGAALN